MAAYSPIRVLWDFVEASPFRIAPEAAESLHYDLRELGVTMKYVDDEPGLAAEYQITTKTIRLGSAFLEALWSAAYLYHVAFRAYGEAQKNGEKVLLVGGEDVQLATAYGLFLNRTQSLIARADQPWPDETPKPLRRPFAYTDGAVANELFLSAIAWIIHHEIAHAALGHEEGSPSAMREEHDADTKATAWVSAGARSADETTKRALGAATAIVFLIALDIRSNRRTFTTHPPTFERLLNVLGIVGLPDNHKVWAFALVLLHLHLQAAGLADGVAKEGTFEEMCFSACMALKDVVIWSM